AVRRRDRHRHGQPGTVEVNEELGLPGEIRVAPDAATSDRELPVDAHAPYVVGHAACESLDANDVVTPLPERLPSHWPHPLLRQRTVTPVSGASAKRYRHKRHAFDSPARRSGSATGRIASPPLNRLFSIRDCIPTTARLPRRTCPAAAIRERVARAARRARGATLRVRGCSKADRRPRTEPHRRRAA